MQESPSPPAIPTLTTTLNYPATIFEILPEPTASRSQPPEPPVLPLLPALLPFPRILNPPAKSSGQEFSRSEAPILLLIQDLGRGRPASLIIFPPPTTFLSPATLKLMALFLLPDRLPFPILCIFPRLVIPAMWGLGRRCRVICLMQEKIPHRQ